MQRALLNNILWCYWKNLLKQNFLELGNICVSKVPSKIKSH